MGVEDIELSLLRLNLMPFPAALASYWFCVSLWSLYHLGSKLVSYDLITFLTLDPTPAKEHAVGSL